MRFRFTLLGHQCKILKLFCQQLELFVIETLSFSTLALAIYILAQIAEP